MKRLLLFLLALVATSALAQAQVKLGIEVLRDSNFELLQGKRVGLITNPTGVDSRLVSTADILHQAAKAGILQLTGLYAPEHGVRGNVVAGATVTGSKDPKTGVPVHSLYGSTKKPTREMLKDVDVLVFDIQDIGSRSYTYISTMGLAMEAAGESGIPFVVLDRPNPLGGLRVEGNEVIKPGFSSFVSQYPIPYVHGMTVGELARLFNGEGLLKNNVKCDLTVVEMKGWKRSLNWKATGLPWVPTSPHIPTPESATYYPATGIIGELGTLQIGVGYTLPFQLIAAAWITDAGKLADRLNSIPELKGVRFRPIYCKPFYGGAKDKDIQGVQLYADAPAGTEEFTPLPLISFYILQELATMYPTQKPLETAQASRLSMFDKVIGTDQVRKAFIANGYLVTPEFVKLWKPSPEWLAKRKQYLIYPN